MAKTATITKQVETLREELRRHEYLYYVLDEPEISDVKFDRMMEELKRLEADHPELVTPDSPTQRVGGAPRKGFETRKHSPPMLSLDNTYSMEELEDFDRRVRELSGRDQVDYVTERVSKEVKRLREMSPLYEMAKEGIDLKSVNWKA